MRLAEEKLPGTAHCFISPAGNVLAIVLDGNLGKLLAARRRIVARNAGLTEISRLEADRAGNRFHWQITQGVGPQRAAMRASISGVKGPS